MTNIDVVFFDAGGGHRSAAVALTETARLENRGWAIELVNLQYVLEEVDLVRRTTGVYSQDLYNWTLRRGWTRINSRALPAMHGIIRLMHRLIVRELCDFWRARKPDLVVSVVPHYNRALYESLAVALPGIPLVTILTDLADHPPHFWLERQTQYFICGSDRAVAQALHMGIQPDQIRRVSGMLLHPRFYAAISPDRAAGREQLGLDPGMPTGLVLFGGYGSAVMLEIMKRLAKAPTRVQLILLCGRNQQLASELTSAKAPIRRVVRTFTDDVAHYMRLSDFFIGKPGPGCVSEAIAMKLPVILERSARTMDQERYTCDWVEQHGAGIVLPNFSRIGSAVAKLLAPAAYPAYRQRIDSLNNRAVFETTEILAEILAVTPGPKMPPAPGFLQEFRV